MSGGFAAWCGATCASCGLPALLHAADGCDETVFTPRCPVCHAAGRRNPRLLALDCRCNACGWFYTSTLKRAVLRALTRKADGV